MTAIKFLVCFLLMKKRVGDELLLSPKGGCSIGWTFNRKALTIMGPWHHAVGGESE